ncbi:hypothetical protein V5O48_010308 [Marasmius crinis-equi]|uniref:Uncharacterized protein n=1 Tax=Marasmius crinis-equi TaxID=585013 RepID=A0ABR3F982_9AGAR
MSQTNAPTSNLSASGYASRRKDLLAVVNQLRSLGAQGELDLPRIVIIGNQSAGKSSVVEALSGISLPRDAGTCTRAPIECRLTSSSEPWSCKIRIRYEYDSSGKRLHQVKNVSFGKTITSKMDVEEALRRAQFSVLNPHLDPTTILETSVHNLTTLATAKLLPFSRNVICVDLKGPELTDLAFIDLPGIIQNADEETVSMVEKMVMSHIKGNCLILVAIPMTDDIENQKALRLARQVDEKGLRTIGVMTKPDMLGSGSLKAMELWTEVVEGRRHPLIHGYYVTRQLNDAERAKNTSPADARRLEESFFSNTQPWCKSKCADRFGTKNLSNALSALLMTVISDSLPGVKQEAEKQLGICKEDLSRLPPPIEEDPATYILNQVIAFASEFGQHVQGGSGDTATLIQSHRGAYEKFKISIRKTAPNFIPFTDKESGNEWDEHLEDEEDKETHTSQKPLNLTGMRIHIEKSRTRELPYNVPFEAKVTLIKQFQERWHPSAVGECYRTVQSQTASVVMNLMQKRFQRHRRLFEDVRNFVSELFDLHANSCLMFLEAVLEMEQTPATQNTHYLQTSKEKWLAKYKSARLNTATPSRSSAESSRHPGDPSRPPSVKNDTTPKTATQTTPVNFKVPSPTAQTDTKGTSTPNSNASSFGAPKPSNWFAEPSSYANVFKPAASAGSFSFSGTTSQPLQKAATPFSFESAKPATPSISSAKSPALDQLPLPESDEANELLAMLAKFGFTHLSFEDLAKLKPGDEYETELDVMAEVRGYFQVAYKRIIDNIPGLIDLRFLKALGKELQPFLVKKLGLGAGSANEACAAYLAEDPVVIAQRNELMARQTRLDSALRELNNFHLRLDGGI